MGAMGAMGAASLTVRVRNLSKKLLVLAASSGLAFAAAEALVRWTAPQQLIRLRPDVWTPAYDGLGWRMAPDVDTWVNTGERDVHLRTDSAGHRIGLESAPPASRTILALGDSFLAAIEVDHADTVTARLEESLSASTGRRIQVVNTGVAGWDPNHYLLEARANLARRSYDLVLVFLFLGNDAIEERIDQFGPKRGEVVHRFRWPRSFDGREIVKAWLYPANDFLERRSHFFILLRRGMSTLLMRVGLSARRFPKTDLRSEAESKRWQVTGELCGDLAALAETHGVETLFVLLPGAYHVDPDLGFTYAAALGLGPEDVDLEQSRRLFTAQLEERGLRFVDSTALLRRLHEAGGETHGQVDTHLSPAGHEAVARFLHEPVLEILQSRAQE